MLLMILGIALPRVLLSLVLLLLLHIMSRNPLLRLAIRGIRPPLLIIKAAVRRMISVLMLVLVLGARGAREATVAGYAVAACVFGSHAGHAGRLGGLGLERLAEAARVLGGGDGRGAPGRGAGGVVGVMKRGGVVHRGCLGLCGGCGMAGEGLVARAGTMEEVGLDT